ncbi:DUF1629 domain-containing protein [Frigidibacter sp. SD6-1]|uniref:imm11 family protein n=1 Tax=Frigidibacter sp. SD6-1 TaxID=3032581 RepID=UPI0024DF4CFC|nr:DUF1629 domain-containing protein [Frigidibacter sp. SD6-1]
MAWVISGGHWTEEDKARYPEVRMSHHWKNLDGDTRQLEVIDASQDDGGLMSGRSPQDGRPIRDKNVPTRLERTGPTLEEYPLQDVLSYWSGNLLVCKAFRDLLEEMEPGVHQFFPMDLLVNGTKVATYYWFVCCTRLATLAADHCYPPLNPRGFWKPSPFGQNQGDRVVLSKRLIGAHHAWYDKFYGKTFFSNAFAERLQTLKLTGIDSFQFPEV